MKKCNYFLIHELVSDKVYQKFGEQAWMFFDEDVLKDLDIIRQQWGSPITINNWFWKGQYKESGLRSNVDSILKSKTSLYLSSHIFGKGFDLKDKKGRNKELHNFVCNLIKENKLKKIKRVESLSKTPTWVHVDAFQTANDNIFIF